MPAAAARLISIQLDTDGAANYQSVGALRSKSMKINSEFVDITTDASPNQWREGLANAGVKSAEFSGEGVFTDTVYQNQALTYCLQNILRNWRFIPSGIGTFQCAMHISTFELGGTYNEGVAFSLTCMSASELLFTGA